MTHDIDPIETQEWLAALESVINADGTERAQFLLQQLASSAQLGTLGGTGQTAYINTISPENQPDYPGDLTLEQRIHAIIRWNAVVMVLRAGKKAPELGGHIATYASAALLYEVGFSHFFRGRHEEFLGDLLYIQGHASPGIYARAFLEGRISEQQLEHFRQEVCGQGVSSYPHPTLMPDFWQFPTVSMGLGPIQAIFQARFLKYLTNRGLIPAQNRKVWMFCGDGEMDEPESLGACSIASREKLDNLIFVVNCNLQRLDGPVRGNGKIIQELERNFKGFGWNVIKVIWGSGWDNLLAKDKSGLLMQRMMECVDGEYQNFKAKDGAYVRENFFGKYPELLELVKDMSDDEIWDLRRGGHDPLKIFSAYKAAMEHKDQPTVILTKSVKGFGMGAAGEALNITHQQKKMSIEELEAFCERFNIPIPKDKIKDLPFYKPKKGSEELKYIEKTRQSLGGYLPSRTEQSAKLTTPTLEAFKPLLESSGEREISTTMAFVRCLSILLKDKNLKEHLVPIVPDECRTFGMEGLFRQIGIYAPEGQLYEPVDREQVMFYRESSDGQLLQEGLNEAGAFCSWMAAGTSYATNNLPMIPFYIYYSMFGFQRIGDLAWAAGDMRTRGFLLGATSGRTTLAGEGLQHTDGHSHVLSSVIPNCISYDPTFAYELAVIIQDGLRRMYHEQENVFYYITVMNENYHQPALPKGAEDGIIKGMYQYSKAKKAKHSVQLLGSGTILREVISAAEILSEYDVAADIWSVTSFTELRRDGLQVDRYNRLHPDKKAKQSYVGSCLDKQPGPVIAATDYMRLVPDQIRAYVKQPYHVLGTDGFGLSDTRKQLRHYFEVSANDIAYTALVALFEAGEIDKKVLSSAKKKLKIAVDTADPWSR